MGRSIAAFYTPDDDLEHAMQVVEPIPGGRTGLYILDVTFSPSTQGHTAPGAYTPLNTIRAIGATYSPIDGYRYIFIGTTDNKIYWNRITGTFNPTSDSLINDDQLVNELIGYDASSIIDIAAYFIDGHIEVLVLMKNGELWRMDGAPWSGKFSWGLIPFFARFEGGRRIALFEGAGWGHVMIATTNNIIEVYYTSNQWGQDIIWTFNEKIIDVGAFYTAEDGVAHIIVATPVTTFQLNQQSNVWEITFVPSQVPPALRQLGTVDFIIDSLGSYVKPDLGRHVIMLKGDGTRPSTELYLSWYYPGWERFQYTQWPPLQAW